MSFTTDHAFYLETSTTVGWHAHNMIVEQSNFHEGVISEYFGMVRGVAGVWS